ncbi:MAG TPA: hypothetical protein VJ888_08860, partial [Mobilitalea sp.]|nr:hypothetical protein [Mobilitalea sp.]
EQPLYSTNEGWLMAGNVVVTNSEKRGNYFYNRYQGDSQRITLAMVYDDSKITFGSETKNSLDYYRDNPIQFALDDINFASTTELKLSSTYTAADKLNWSSGSGISSTNYSSRYWNYNGLINGYMPYITHAPTNNYKMDESIRVLKYQEDYMPDEDDDTKIAIDDKGMYIYQYETYQGGVPVPGSGAITRRLLKMAKMNFNVPTAKFYTVDADKLNLEFSEINPEAAFQVKAAGVIIAESKINQRVFTLNYDFRTELEILVTDGVDEISYEIWPEDVSRNIMTWDSDYYYITSGGVMGSMDTMEGQYVNLYAGHALDAYGVVYDMTTGDQMYIFEGISLAKTVQPLHSFEYDGYQIETNADYSVVREVTRDKLRLYVKNNELSAISSGMSLIIDSLILDNYNGDKYCSVLSTEGMIVNMTDKELVMPDDFVNEEIQYMTHNINSTNHILLVRYYDGAVAGFNYISGEKLDINSPRGTSTLLTTENGMMGRSMNTSLANFSLLYMDIMEFKTDLTDIGWAEVNGINIESGDNVSAADAEIQEEGSLALYVEDAFELDDGTLVGVDKPSIVSADQLLRADKTEFANFIPENEGLYSDYISELADSPLPLAVSEVPSEVVNNILEIKIASLDAAINAANKYGASHAELMALQKELEYLKTLGATEVEIVALKAALAKVTKDGTLEAEDTWFVSDAYAGTAEAALLDSMKEAAAKDNMSKVEDPDNLAEDAAIDNLPKAAADGSKTLVSNSKSDFDDAAEVEKDKKKTSKIATNKKISTPIYITVYDEETSKYVMYDEQELLTKKDEELKTMNEKVERSGHMIDYRAKQVVDVKKPVDENIYGYILLSVAISGIALLLSAMMLRKRKEAVV